MAFCNAVTRRHQEGSTDRDTVELFFNTARSLHGACAGLLASATDAQFDELPNIAFTPLTAMNGTTRAVFEFSAQVGMVKMLRSPSRILCRG